MTTKHVGEGPPHLDDPRKISRWTQTYAQHRSLALVFFQIVFIVLFLGMTLPSYYMGNAYRAGNVPLFWLCIVVLMLAFAGTVFLSVPWWGGRQIERLATRFYAGGARHAGHPTRSLASGSGCAVAGRFWRMRSGLGCAWPAGNDS